MGNQAGEQGLPLHPRALETLREVQQFAEKHKHQWEIICDIGVNRDTLDSVRKAGATGVAVVSALWKAPDFAEAADALLGLA